MKRKHQVYIHYGSTSFDTTIGFPIRNSAAFTKPNGGLWASRKDASFGWKRWREQGCLIDCVEAKSFKFIMKNDDRIYRIHNLDELNALPHMKNDAIHNGVMHHIDFEACLEAGYDAIELCWYGREFKDMASDNLHYALYGWDCDSIVVLNPDAVVEI